MYGRQIVNLLALSSSSVADRDPIQFTGSGSVLKTRIRIRPELLKENCLQEVQEDLPVVCINIFHTFEC